MDGTSSTCSSPNVWVGILYQGAGGRLTNSTVANAPQCFRGISAFADATTNLTFSNNANTGCSSECMEVDYATNTTITGNTIASSGGFPNGIQLQNLDGPSTVSNNWRGSDLSKQHRWNHHWQHLCVLRPWHCARSPRGTPMAHLSTVAIAALCLTISCSAQQLHVLSIQSDRKLPLTQALRIVGLHLKDGFVSFGVDNPGRPSQRST